MAQVGHGRNKNALRSLVWGIIAAIVNPIMIPGIVAMVLGTKGIRHASAQEAAGVPGHRKATSIIGLVLGILATLASLSLKGGLL